MSKQPPAAGPVISTHEHGERDGLTPKARIADRLIMVCIRVVICAYVLWAFLVFLRSIKP